MSFDSPSPAFVTCPKCHASVQSPGIGKACECGNCACQLFIDKNGNPVDLEQADLHAPSQQEPAPQPQPVASPEQTAISLPSSTSSEEMAFGYCPSCHASFYVPANSQPFKCDQCGQEMRLGNAEGDNAPGNSGAQGGAEHERQAQPAPSGCPALDSWKTSVLFSILGLVLSFVWMGVAGCIIGIAISLSLPSLPNQYVFALGAPINGLIYQLVSLVYVVSYYPSYFKEKPLIKSRRAISCLNFLFGGVIFGSLWNHNLTRKEKGISYVVCTILTVLAFCSISFQLLWQVPQYEALNAQYATTSDDLSTKARIPSPPVKVPTEDADGVVISEDGFTATFPTEPEIESDSTTVLDQYEVSQTLYFSTDDKNMFLVDVVYFPDEFRSMWEDSESGIKGGLGAVLSSYARQVDASSDAASIQYDEFQGCPSASMAFDHDGYFVQGMAVWAGENCYICIADTPGEKAGQQFISSFSLLK